MIKNKKILKIVAYMFLILILISGTLMIVFKGFNFNLKYDKNVQIEINLNKAIDKKEISKIASEVFKNQEIILENINNSKRYILITTNKISEKQKDLLITKINEKNTAETITKDNLDISKNKQVNLISKYSQYFKVVIISLGIILLYMIIKYKKIGLIKIILYTIGSIFILQWLYISIIALTRIPIYIFIYPVSLILFIINIFALTLIFEKLDLKGNIDKKEKDKNSLKAKQ